MNNWITQCYSRMLIDNHITEDNPAYMTRFDPAQYVAMIKRAGVTSSMVYASCHNGNCYYPTKVGHMHKNLNGRDIFGETVTLLRKEGIVPVAYYTSVYHNHTAKTHPAWRFQDFYGRQHDGRYWLNCVNSRPYREFTKAQIGEVIDYDVDGIFIDMTFWPGVCFCANCRSGYLAETGRELPTVVDWRNPVWVSFQRFRERSMVEFTQELTAFIKSRRDITVTHQSSPIIMGWLTGQSAGIAAACDYTSGDFYGGKVQHILGAKILSATTRRQPFEFMTSRCVNLNDHTSMKSAAELTCEAATTLANGGAYFFIDAINPDGTLEVNVFDRLGKVSQTLAPFTRKMEELNPVLSADTGLYFSMPSHVEEKMNGAKLGELFDKGGVWNAITTGPAMDEMSGESIILTHLHRPFRVVASDRLDLEGLKTLVINNALFMSAEEVAAVREFVHRGGTLVATGLTSLLAPDGSTTGDFALKDVFGVSYSSQNSRRFHYLSQPEGSPIKYISCYRPAPLVRATTTRLLAGVNEPLFDPDDPEHYTSIHSNPPGRLTEFTGLSVNQFGAGQCIYLYSSLLAHQQDAQQTFGAWLFQQLAPSESIVTNAPVAVEITLLKSTVNDSSLVCLVNYQKELPNIPVHHLTVSLQLPGLSSPRACLRVSDGKELPFAAQNGAIAFTLDALDTIEMVEIIP
jgi:hypothetical protein